MKTVEYRQRMSVYSTVNSQGRMNGVGL